VKAGEVDFVIADIPGLVEGAHEGTGLGHRFLGHVERTSALLHIVDCTQDDIVGAYKTIRGELEKYDTELTTRKEIIAVNKVDVLGDELAADQAKTLSDAIGKEVHQISAVAGMGVKELLYALATAVEDDRNAGREDEDREISPWEMEAELDAAIEAQLEKAKNE